jgi:DNA-binding NarL/FixJ family response regulator
MPILSGIDAAGQLRETGSRTKLVFLTVHSDRNFVNACLDAGGSGYVVKIRTDTDLLPALREALASRIFRPNRRATELGGSSKRHKLVRREPGSGAFSGGRSDHGLVATAL